MTQIPGMLDTIICECVADTVLFFFLLCFSFSDRIAQNAILDLVVPLRPAEPTFTEHVRREEEER